MKKLSILFIVITIVFTACSKDDNTNNQTDVVARTYDTSGDIIGTWRGVDIIEPSGKITLNETETPGTITKEPYQGDFEMIFSENPNQLTSVGTYSLPIIASVPDVITFPYTLQNENFPSGTTWIRSGDILTITEAGREPREYTIIELSSTSLKLRANTIDNIPYGNVVIQVEIEAVIVFERV